MPTKHNNNPPSPPPPPPPPAPSWPPAAVSPQPAYPANLTSLGYTNWKCVFNPNLTLPVAQVIGNDCVSTPLCYNAVSPNGQVNQDFFEYTTSASGLTITYPKVTSANSAASANTYGAVSFSTMDSNFNGFATQANCYVEMMFTATEPPNQIVSPAYNVCAWMTSEQAWNPAYGGNASGGASAPIKYNRAEYDFIEINPYGGTVATWGPDPGLPILASSSLHFDTGDGGPYGADFCGPPGSCWYQAQNESQYGIDGGNAYNYPFSSFFNEPMIVGGVWLNGTGGFPNTCTTFWNETAVLIATTPSSWTSPNPDGPPSQWITGGIYPNSNEAAMTYTLGYIRVWAP